MTSECPSEWELAQLLEPDFDLQNAESVSAHLEGCESCRDRLDRLAHQSWENVGPILGSESSMPLGGESPAVIRAAMEGLMRREAPNSEEVSSESDWSGRIFGEFEILREIAKGGMGVVYRARQRNLNRLVALKLLGSGTMVSQDRVARFRTETEAVATIEHPNIVPIYGVGEVEGQPYFSMKLIEGGSLAQRLSDLTPVSLGKTSLSNRSDLHSRQRRIVDIMISICRAIQYTHERGILHRDLKPNNVLMDERGEPQITDFGLAKILEKDSSLTDSFAVMGTPSYMAPEQATGHSRQITTSADIYGLGAIFYELLCGVPPFREATPLATMRRVIDSEPEPPRRLCSMIDADLETVCLKALNKEPNHRYDSALRMAEDLERWRRGDPVLARPIGVIEKSWRWGRRNPLATALVGLVVVLIGVMVIGSLLFGVRLSELYSESEMLLTDFQLRKAEELLEKGESMTGISFLGKILEQNPSHRVAATRLVSALIHRDLAVLKTSPMDHGNPVWDIRVSSDQKHLASLAIDGSVALWGLGEGSANVPMLESTTQRVRSIAFESNGDRLIGGCESGEVLVWDVATGGLLGTRSKHNGSVEALSVGLGRPVVVSGGADAMVHVWDLNSGEAQSTSLRHDRSVLSVSLTRRGDYVLTTSDDGIARVWKVATGEMVAGPFPHFGPLKGASFDPLERRLVTYGMGPKAIIWDVKENRPATMNIEHKAPITHAAFNPDGRTLVTVGEDGYARVWDAVSGKLIREVSTRKTRVESVCFGPLGRRLLLVVSGGVCQLWDGACERMLVNEMRHPDRVNTAIFGRDGRSIVTGCDDGRIRVWDVGSLPAWETMVRHHGPVNDAAVTRDGQALVTAGQDGFVRVTDPKTGLNQFRPLRLGYPIGFVAVTETGDKILAGEHSLRRLALAGVWDGMTGNRLAEPIRQGGNFTCGVFSPNGERMVLGDERGRVAVWRTNNDLEPVLRYAHIGPVHCVGFDHSGTRVVSGGSDGQAMIAGFMGGERPEGVIQHGGRVQVAIFHPNDEIVLTASSDHTARLWRLSDGNGQALGGPLKHEDAVNWAEFSPDGATVLTASGDGTVSFWDVSTQARRGVPIQHSGPVLRAHYDGTGQRVLVIGADLRARVWDVDSRFPVTEPMRHGRDIFAGFFSPDSRSVITASADDAARIWRVPEPPLPFPEWFGKFLGCVTGMTVDSKGTRQVLDEGAIAEIRREVSQLPRSGYYETLARWLLDSGEVRTIGPHSQRTLKSYVDEEIQFGSFTSLNVAMKYAPTRADALGRHATLLLRDSMQNVRSKRDAEYYSRQAVVLNPESPELWQIRADVMRANGHIEAEWEAMERVLELSPDPAPLD